MEERCCLTAELHRPVKQIKLDLVLVLEIVLGGTQLTGEPWGCSRAGHAWGWPTEGCGCDLLTLLSHRCDLTEEDKK